MFLSNTISKKTIKCFEEALLLLIRVIRLPFRSAKMLCCKDRSPQAFENLHKTESLHYSRSYLSLEARVIFLSVS
uniref:AlNc14C2G282 protein n=1 Tax=Albugo laibachii Nc14 TaxID=890382 RepID=F0VZE4_9STRA|nr:AlNc14C2G282 [Albugo laibachii Nc14]|eukprot:CCA14174.1 AlNc14C2G282 [Albugo laibachii Nc14]